MAGTEARYQRRILHSRNKLIEKLIYLPGATIILYGFWLTLTL